MHNHAKYHPKIVQRYIYQIDKTMKKYFTFTLECVHPPYKKYYIYIYIVIARCLLNNE